MKKIYSFFLTLLCCSVLSMASAATIKVYIPQDGSMAYWNLGAVYFWAWNTSSDGADVVATSEGNGWYSANISQSNFLVKDQAGWDNFPGTSHQSVDMTISGDACYSMSNGTNIEGNGDSWKKILTTAECGSTPTTPVIPVTPSGSYYVAGLNDNWDAQAYPMTNGSLTINLEAGNYQFKITDGTWGDAGVNNWGYYYYNSECSTIAASKSDEVNWNVLFVLTAASEVTITFDGTQICLSGEGGGTPVIVPTGDYYVAGTGPNSWPNSVEWDPSAEVNKLVNGEITFENLPAGEYKFKITQGNWSSPVFGADAIGVVSEGISVTSDNDGNIVFTLTATKTITISFLNNKVNISAEGSEVNPVGPAYIEYSTAHPAGIEDVMLQGFYWDSNGPTEVKTGTGTRVQYTQSYYGQTRWDNLDANASELAQYFDLIWLPPSAYSSGGLGYHPRQMSNQSGDLGSKRSLKTLIEHLHQGGCKVIADIVVNHRGNASSWCDFIPDHFVTSDNTNYGSFQFTAKHICGDDEVWSATEAGAKTCQTANPSNTRGAYDTGEHYDPARDLDHSNAYVRNAIKAYLKWLRHEMQYDGLRWDVAGGFGQSYLGEYVDAAKPYISMAEKWEGDAQHLWSFIGRTGNKTCGLDFAVKYSAFNDGINAGNYNKLRGAGLPGLGHAEYSVPFIDNHDTFERFDTQPSENNEFGGKGSFQTALKALGTATPTVAQARGNAHINKVLQANAFLLAMPGVPCVFYPHWYSLKAQIKEMILARKAAGITNTSSVNDESGNGYYKATIQGNRGELLLRVGPNSDYTNCPNGYTRMAGGQSGDNYAMFVKTTAQTKPDLSVSPAGGRYIGGTTVTMTATFGGVIYYTLDGSVPSATNGTQYTAPINITANNTVLKAVAINAAGSSAIQSHTYITENPVRTEPITIKFWKPAGWTACNIWAWNDTDPHIGSSSASWPGNAAMTDEGDGWWTITFDMSVEVINGLVFNDGTKNKQTGDYTEEVITESTCFTWSGERWDGPRVVPCDYTALPEVKTADIRIYPNPTTDILYIDGENADNANIYVFDITGRQVINQRNTTGMIPVNTLTTGMYIMKVVDTEGRQMQHHFIKK